MRLSISNIAWDVAEDEAIAALLQQHGIDAIDIAPMKYFPRPAETREQDVYRLRQWWRDRGIEIVGMQALLFGTDGLNVFGPAEVQDAMLRHLDAVCRIGADLGARRLVFGSPRNRNREGLGDELAFRTAHTFFVRLGDIAGSHGVVICLEPNPEAYGANFMTTSSETAAVVAALAHESVKMQLDTGAMTMNGEDPLKVIRDHARLIGHIHASEPDLRPLGDGHCPHERVFMALDEYLPEGPVTIEMVATTTEPHAASIARALAVAARDYRHVTIGAGSCT